jgi:hypothetical protein
MCEESCHCNVGHQQIFAIMIRTVIVLARPYGVMSNSHKEKFDMPYHMM